MNHSCITYEVAATCAGSETEPQQVYPESRPLIVWILMDDPIQNPSPFLGREHGNLLKRRKVRIRES